MLREIALWKQQKLCRGYGLVAGLNALSIRHGSLTLVMRANPAQVYKRSEVRVYNLYQTNLSRRVTYWLMTMPGAAADPTRPGMAARSLLKIVTRESTLRIMEPFYSGMVRKVLREEQQEYKSRPNKAINLIWSLFGRENAFQTLTRFYLGAVQRMGTGYYSGMNTANTLYLASGVILQSKVYRRFAQQVWRSTLLKEHAAQRYALREAATSAAGYLHRLPLTRREDLEREAVQQITRVQSETVPQLSAVPAISRITDEEMRYIVRNVSAELEKQMHFEAVRRGRR